MNLVDPTTVQQPTVTKAIKPGAPTGAFTDPAQMGAMIQKMYPQYANFDATTLGQRWIDLHTPKQAIGAGGVDGMTDTLQGPGAMTGSGQNTPDPASFRTPIQQQPQKKQLSLTQGMQALNPNVTSIAQAAIPGYQVAGDNTLYSAPQLPQQPKPQPPKLSTYDITKAGY